VPKRFPHRAWLEHLIEEELARHDPETARARLPADVRVAGTSPTDLAPGAALLVTRSLRQHRLGATPSTPEGAFLAEIRAHVGLALDLALVRGDPFLAARRRAELAAFLAAAVGGDETALAVEPELPGGASDLAVSRALRVAGDALHVRFFPPGDPADGLPLHAGAVAVLRRRLARIVVGFHREGLLGLEALARHGAYAARESVLLVEALSGLLAAAGRDGKDARAVRLRQVARLGLSRRDARAARQAVAAPRSPEALAEAAPERVRAFLLEQLLLAQLRLELGGGPAGEWIESYARAARLDPQTLLATQVEAAAQHGDHGQWIEAFVDGGVDWQALAGEWEDVADQVVERVSSAVTENLEALVTEIRETGELGQLLAKAAAGNALTGDEKRKVRAQLIDLAKAVPALAIFAAPGGMLLLPLLAKLLPFSLMPSAWKRTAAPSRPRPRVGSAP
jgi:hypothetical protein